MNLAQRLVKSGVLEPEQLAPALFRQKKSRGFLAKHLLDLDLVEPEVLAQFVHAYPPLPETFEDLGLPKGLLIQLLLKHSFFRDSISSQEMAHDLKISRRLVDELFAYLKGQGYIQVKARDALSQTNHLALELRYSLTDAGKIYAEQCLESNRYVGPAPVPLEDYWDWVEAQSINQVKVEKARLKEVFADYVVPEHLLTKLGPAINSGRSIFLFGPSGNGKTMIANCVGHAYQDAVYVPYALLVYGQIIRLYDELNHQPVPLTPETPAHDRRWVLCRRPIVIAGGEMTEDALELRFNPHLKYYEAPHQMGPITACSSSTISAARRLPPGNCSTAGFIPWKPGKTSVASTPAQQFAVPFDQLIIFSTNLNPYSLADEAFLRRIRHKIFIGYVSPEQYLEIFRRVCAEYQIDFNAEAIRDMMARYYVISSRPFCACHPRDLVENLIDRARFLEQKPQLTSQELDYVCQTYFVKPMDVTDYDAIGDEPKAIV